MSLLDAAGVMNGDIWCNGAFDFESPLKDLLESGKYTLEQLLAEDELLQELRGVHPQLIEFFSSQEVVAGLIQYIILPPSTKPTAKRKFDDDEKSIHDDKSIHDEILGIGKEQSATEKDGGSTEIETEFDEIENKENSMATTAKQPGKWLEGDASPEEDVSKKEKSMHEEEEDLHIRFPYMACEVICCEIKSVIDLIVDGTVPNFQDDKSADEPKNDAMKRKQSSSNLISDDARGKPILDLFFSILYKSEMGEIDDYRAGYLEKILSILFRHRPKDIAQYLNKGGGKGNLTLMSAMFKHLYSHSLMQVVQRLLLPQLPRPSRLERDEAENNNAANESEDIFNETMEGMETDRLDSFHCNWSESEEALQMVLECLIGENSNEMKQQDDDDKEDRKLDLYQNSSEVLITIIQNSPLTSLTMRTLTTNPILGKLISAATCVEEGLEFSRHDSRLTCAMNVLESLILQLGGYGSVGTMIYEGDGQAAFESVMEELVPDEHKSTSDILQGGSTSSTISTTGQQVSTPSTTVIKNYATPETLIKHLPTMMSSLSNLLLYPGAEKWLSPMQFSKTKAQNLLGSSRLRIVRLLESLVLLGNKDIDSLLCESNCLEVCLDLFWKFQWCSMLHQSVANLLVHAFEGQNSRSELQLYFIERCNLLGRLMYSFWEKEEVEGNITSIINASTVELAENILGNKDSDNEKSPTLSSFVSEKENGSTNDVLLVSDDDVDSAIEQQEDAASMPSLTERGQSHFSTRHSKLGNGSDSDHDDMKYSSFRLGYMGHVIIICQALVQAYTEEIENHSSMIGDQNNASGEMTDEQGELESHLSRDSNQESLKPNEESYTDCTSADNSTPSTSLILARLVRKHPLGKIWKDFVQTTLAVETTQQSTPLGGFQATTLGTDPLHMHRPGLEDESAYDDDSGEAPSLPQRGLLVDGDLIDMDDNDLEVAATMMAVLNLEQVADNGRHSETESNPSHQNGYIFDDPLGGERFGEFDVDDDGDSSSEEEVEMDEDTDLGSAKSEVPVMNLFAGNFDAFDETDILDQANGSWSDFANFDNAFANANTVEDDHQNEENNNFDSIFGDVKSRDILLDDVEKPM